jgi:hypothetical protein
MKLVLDPKIKDVQFMTKTSQPYSRRQRISIKYNSGIRQPGIRIPVFGRGL